jgi:putative ABC transport system substrate-binding protein
MTGSNILTSELAAKRLELLRELVPQATRVAVLVNSANVAATETQLKDVGAAARAIGLQIQIHNANTSAEIDAAFETMSRERPDPCSSRPARSSMAGASNWPNWRRSKASRVLWVA